MYGQVGSNQTVFDHEPAMGKWARVLVSVKDV